MKAFFLLSSVISFFLISCNSQSETTLAENQPKTSTKKESRTLSQDFKDYWYAGQAEITSYTLSQERYGEMRDGQAVLIFVTEEFLPKIQVKADNPSPQNIPVLKLNKTKNYLTGIYPYSVMSSTFSPVNTKGHAIKNTYSMQEWCGHVFVQLNNHKNFEIESRSYFEGEADQQLQLEKTWLESELWNLIRINPEELPNGEIKVLPSFEYFRMSHKPIAALEADGNLVKGDSISTYTLSYPNQKRELRIYFESSFPYEIERWEETHPNGLKTTAEKLKRIKSAYWGKNSNDDRYLRDSLLLKS